MSGSTLSQRTISTSLTVPSGTLSSAPVTANLQLGFVRLVELEVRIPAGHLGFTGFAIDHADVRLVPWNDPSQWLVGDNDLLRYPLDIDAPRVLVMKGFNTGTFSHAFYLRFSVTDVPNRDAGRSTLLLPV